MKRERIIKKLLVNMANTVVKLAAASEDDMGYHKGELATQIGVMHLLDKRFVCWCECVDDVWYLATTEPDWKWISSAELKETQKILWKRYKAMLADFENESEE